MIIQPICDKKTPLLSNQCSFQSQGSEVAMSDLKEGGGRGRGTKRKLEDKAPGGKKSKGELSTPPLPSNGYPKVFKSVESTDIFDKPVIKTTCIYLSNPGAPIQPGRLSLRACRAGPSCTLQAGVRRVSGDGRQALARKRLMLTTTQ